MLTHLEGYSRDEVRHLARTEHVVHLGDLVYRRTSAAFVGAVTAGLLDELAEVAGDALGWSAARRRREVEQLAADLVERHGVRLASAPARAD
jgi:glycerol-3-phosphate dehydrogenase